MDSQKDVRKASHLVSVVRETSASGLVFSDFISYKALG